MELRLSEEKDLLPLSAWFSSQAEATNWGGPLIKFPIVIEQLKKDIQWEEAMSFTLVDHQELLGFAQVLDKYGCNHISRVAVNPAKRRLGLGLSLMELVFASTKASRRNYSLFVYENNVAAKQLYEKLDFQVHPYPDGQDNIAGCLFMVKTHRE